MKKLSLLFIVLLCLGLHAFGQIDWREYAETYPDTFNNDSTQVGIVTCIEKRDESLKGMVEENYTSPNYEINKAAKAEHDRERSGNNIFVYNFRKTPAYFFVKNINSSNANDYEYQVTETGGKIIVPWSDIKKFEKPYYFVGPGSTGMMGALGSYTANYGQRIVVNLRLKKSNEIISTAIAEWVSVQPKFGRVFTNDQMNDFFNLLTHNWIERNASKPDLTKLKSTQNSLIFLLEGTITDKSQMDYQLLKDGKVYLGWRKNDFDNNFIWLKNLPHGNYQLRVRYNAQPEHIGSCNFIIKPAWYQTTAIKLISGSLLAVFFALIATVAVLLVQKRNAALEAEKQKRLQTELQVIRSQLNPHFIFNSLSSIQGLINKQDIAGANNYLTEFSDLLRNTLNNSEQEQLPLDKEIRILETYLNLEQLRFDFDYQIEVESDINRYETEIPSLLLQPILENAVKHGVSILKDTGKILVRFNRKGLDMIVTVSDNGKGFNANTVSAGHGLKLVHKRIELLNDVLKNDIKFSINSDKNSLTEIIVTFVNWFA